MPFRADKIAPDLWRVRPGAADGNCYLLTEQKILIDTGAGRNTGQLIALLETLQDELRWVLLTHEDLDHTGGAAHLAQATGARVACHEAAAGPIGRGRPRSFGRSLSGKVLGALARGQVHLARGGSGVPVDLALSSGDAVGGLTAIHLPGHSPGSCAYFEAATGRLFSGDACLTKRELPDPATSASPLDPPRGLFTWDATRAERSLATLAALPITGVYPGHGPPFIAGTSSMRRAFRDLLMVY